jgi:hypothetical protein
MYESGVVNILDPVTNEVINHCYGPTATGGCPLAAQNGIVACHGCRIEAPNAGPEYWDILIPATSQNCPRAFNLEVLGY